jgi:hypothetical protein
MNHTVQKRRQCQLRRLNPDLSRKAKEFYARYGRAIRVMREQFGIVLGAIPRLSASQLRLIERGECRAESKVIAVLAKAHKLTPNEYLGFVAKILANIPRSLAARTPFHQYFPLCPRQRGRLQHLLRSGFYGTLQRVCTVCCAASWP